MAAWLQDEIAVQAFLEQKTKPMLDTLDASGFVCVQDFLPSEAAEAVLAAVQNLQNWELADGEDDEGYSDATPHRFALAELDGSREEPEEESDGEGQGLDQSQYIDLDGVKPCKGSDSQQDPKSSGKFPRRDRVTLRLFGRLLWNLYRTHTHPDGTTEETLPNFTAACYRRGDHIAPHNDDVLETYERSEVEGMKRYFERDSGAGKKKEGGEAVVAKSTRDLDAEEDSPTDEDVEDAAEEENSSDPVQVDYSRQIALVYYLNKDWKAEYGGQLKDLETGKKVLPEFNSLVLFRIPRMHRVLPVKKKQVKRFSIFGWWLCEKREHRSVVAEGKLVAQEVASKVHGQASGDRKIKGQEDVPVAAESLDIPGKRSSKRKAKAEKQENASVAMKQVLGASGSGESTAKRRKRAQ